MLLIVNRPQARLIAAVEARGITASIGPTSSTGWTTVWTSEESQWSAEGQGLLPTSCGARYLAIDEIAEGLQLDVFGGAGEVLSLVWSSGPEVGPAGPVEAVAVGLTAMFGCPDLQRDLEELLRGEPLDDEELVKSLGLLMDLPELDEPAPACAAVAHRGQHQLARLAASLAGPVYLKVGSDRWTVLMAPHEEGRSMELAAGASGAGSRGDLVILIWRDGSGSGWSLWRRGEPVANGSWNARWRHVESDPHGAEEETVRPLVKALGPQVDENTLRALLRTGRADQDPLAQLVTLLRLPADLLEALDSPKRFCERSGVEYIEHTSVRNAVLQGGFDPDAPTRWPALATAFAIGTVVAAGMCVAITMLFIVVVATGGGFADRAGVSSDEWTTLALFAVLSLVLVPTAVFRVRRIRRRRARATG